jgi:hypothetical protein
VFPIGVEVHEICLRSSSFSAFRSSNCACR